MMFSTLILFFFIRIITGLVDEIEESIKNSSLLRDLRMSKLPDVHAKCTDLIKLLVISICKFSYVQDTCFHHIFSRFMTVLI